MKRFLVVLLVLCNLGCPSMGMAGSATVTYIYTDGQGSPVAEADGAGNVTATFDYTPYGSTLLGTQQNGPGYTGHVSDPDTSLTYMQARYYDPSMGQFLSVDPVMPSEGKVAALGAYSYANNNPYRFTDPDGRQAFGSADPVRDYQMYGSGEAGVMLMCGCNPNSNLPPTSGSGAVESILTMPETMFSSGSVRVGKALGGAINAARSYYGVTSLYRAVNPSELSELVSNGGSFRNPMGIQVKYFSPTADGASDYARQTFGTPLYEGPYTTVKTSIRTQSITPEMRATVDRGISTITVPTEKLDSLSSGKPMTYIPMPPNR